MAQGSWAAGFDHQHSGPSVHPSSHSITNAANWITANINNPAGANNVVGPHNRLNVVHACLIPSGPHRGEVLVWDGNNSWIGVRAYQPWAIVNPYWPATNPFVASGGGGYRFYNALEPCPLGTQGERLGDLFCAGQHWLSNGRLFVAGGTRAYPHELGGVAAANGLFEGSKLVYQWDPNPVLPGDPFGKWHPMPSLAVERWYPTVTTDGTTADRALILGGTDWDGSSSTAYMPAVNTYESYLPLFAALPQIPAAHESTSAGSRLYSGPTLPFPAPSAVTVPGFNNYPRIHALGVLDPIVSGGSAPRLFVSGYWSMGFRWGHDPFNDPTPTYGFGTGQAAQAAFIDDGTSLLYPAAVGAIPSLVLRIGGARQATFFAPPTPNPVVASNSVESANATVISSSWSTGGPNDIPDMQYERYHGNIVILPNRELFAVGGTDAHDAFNLTPEILRVGGDWKEMAPHASPRDYHSTALLLPDGRVFVAGGEGARVNGTDYEIYTPEYLQVPASHRPQNVGLANEVTLAPISQTLLNSVDYQQTCVASWAAQLPVGVTVEEAVLMAPAALTHHDDGGQRCIPLQVLDYGPGWDPLRSYVRLTMPASQRHAPPGWYMLFLLTTAGVPSNAYWINLR